MLTQLVTLAQIYVSESEAAQFDKGAENLALGVSVFLWVFMAVFVVGGLAALISSGKDDDDDDE